MLTIHIRSVKPKLVATQKKMTPMLRQFLEIKKEHPDSILFYRLGDFYEMFFEDALNAAPILGVQLTSRDKNSDNPVPMCGVPHHSASGYISKLLAAGRKVALCEQMEDPSTTKGIVKRGVVRIYTPALVGDPDLVEGELANLLACVHPIEKGPVQKVWSLCTFDLLAGKSQLEQFETLSALCDYLIPLSPKEFLVADTDQCSSLRLTFPNAVFTQRASYFETKIKSSVTESATLAYLQETQQSTELGFSPQTSQVSVHKHMRIDATSLQALEVLRPSHEENSGSSLFHILDHTRTAMGRRLLKQWLHLPLLDIDSIESRLDAVETLYTQAARAKELGTLLSSLRDLERLAMKTALGLSMPRDLLAVRDILRTLPAIALRLGDMPSSLLRDLGEGLCPLPELEQLLSSALLEEPAAGFKDGGVFQASHHPELQELRELSQNAKQKIAEMEQKERDQTKIASLKIKFNKVFGYSIEVTKTHLSKVPAHYIRKQTISNGERFITEELKEFESKALTADQKLKSLEESLFIELRGEVAARTNQLLASANNLAALDVILSFALVARERGYCRPELHKGENLLIEEGRHPVVESLLERGQFVPNSIELGPESGQLLLITGPNMAGKSTIMRQVALVVLLSHVGSFVPAKRAIIPNTDAIFTRIGSSDDLSHGKSTFMVEMTEMARILQSATSRSLILIDEIGRGTSTYDGLSLAWSIVEYLHNEVDAKTLFATHFHELTGLEKQLPRVRNTNVLVKKWKDDIVFLHKLANGVCNRSYGIEVAKLAGLPDKLLVRAKSLLGVLESQSARNARTRNQALQLHDNQLAFFESLTPSETPSQLEV